MDFTVEEMNLMCIYSTSSKHSLLIGMKRSLPYVEDNELETLMTSLIERLEHMSEEVFSAIVFSAAFDDADFYESVGGYDNADDCGDTDSHDSAGDYYYTDA